MRRLNPTSIAVALIALFGVILLGNAYNYKFQRNQSITVTGKAEKDFTADLVVWRGSFSRKSMNLREAYSQLRSDEQAIRRYLLSSGLKENDLVFSSVSIEKQFDRRYDPQGYETSSNFTGYNLVQQIEVKGKELDRIEKISRESTSLIDQGIEFNSFPPAYYYSKLSELKHDLLAKAAEDAKLRAEKIAENTGGSLGKIIEAKMGIFQITGQYSGEEQSWGGAFNTVDKNKTASITTQVQFRVD